MQKKCFFKAAVLKAAVFCLLILISTLFLNRLVTPKFLVENSSWPSTSTFVQFYEMDKNSVDVLFLGSSSMSTAGIPQYLYDQNKITSYNLASPEQTLITSYYWLQEALRFQSPSVVFLDNQMLFTYYEDEPLNFKEPGLRKDFDRMKWSKVKVSAVNDICALDSSQSKLSYYFPLLRYHDRFKELSKLDFSYEISKLYGYAPLSGNFHEDGELVFSPLMTVGDPTSDSYDKAEHILPLMQDYMDRIVNLCQEKDITLILVSTLSPVETQARHDLTTSYAENHNITFIDFNTIALYQTTGLDYFTDCPDDHHMNLSGGEKITTYLGNYLLSEGLVSPKDSTIFEGTRQYYLDFIAELGE